MSIKRSHHSFDGAEPRFRIAFIYFKSIQCYSSYPIGLGFYSMP